MTRDRRVIFVMGLPRSGTTLVDLVLGAHPEARALGELAKFGRADRSVQRAGGLCGICETTCPFWEGAVAPGFRRRWFSHRAIGAVARQFGPRLGLYEELFRADPEVRVLSDSSKSLGWLECRLADPRDWRSAEPVFLMVTRDGRAVVNSWMRKSPDTPMDDHIARWVRLADGLEAAWEGFAGHKARIAYEALAADPQAGARRLAEVAGLSPAPAPGMARYWEADQHPVGGNVGTRTLILRHRDPDGALPFTPSSREKTAYYAAQGLAITPDTRWKGEMSAEAQARFEAGVGARNAAYRAAAEAVPA